MPEDTARKKSVDRYAEPRSGIEAARHRLKAQTLNLITLLEVGDEVILYLVKTAPDR